jgi:hypothetical protein
VLLSPIAGREGRQLRLLERRLVPGLPDASEARCENRERERDERESEMRKRERRNSEKREERREERDRIGGIKR